jgi:hypothetical protein
VFPLLLRASPFGCRVLYFRSAGHRSIHRCNRQIRCASIAACLT